MLCFLFLLLGIQGMETRAVQIRGNSRRAQQKMIGIEDGMWRSRGYGWVLKSENGTVSLLEETELSCIPSQGYLQYITAIEQDGENIVLKAAPTLNDYVGEPIPETDQGPCSNGLTPVVGDANYTPDALFVFDILFVSFWEHYAFFELRGIDWEASMSEARASLTPDSADDQLFGTFVSVLDPLDDAHVFLFRDNTLFDSKPLQAREMLKEEFEQQDEIDFFETYERAQLERWIQSISGYMREPLQADAESIFFWGQSKDSNVGYMLLLSFAPQDVDAFFQNVNNAFAALTETETIIFDIRINTGGFDAVALLLASHFVSVPVTVISKHAVDGDGFTESTKVNIEPGDAAYRYTGGVVLIVSGSTISSAEKFAVAMKQLPQVTIVGQTTAGALSDVLRRQLPNGWWFSMSNEVLTDVPEGIVYEMTGVPPDILTKTELLSLTDREAGEDSWLQLALATAIADETPSESFEIFNLARLNAIGAVSFMLSVLL
jgi:carboxyl-terminal processing protease